MHKYSNNYHKKYKTDRSQMFCFSTKYYTCTTMYKGNKHERNIHIINYGVCEIQMNSSILFLRTVLTYPNCICIISLTKTHRSESRMQLMKLLFFFFKLSFFSFSFVFFVAGHINVHWKNNTISIKQSRSFKVNTKIQQSDKYEEKESHPMFHLCCPCVQWLLRLFSDCSPYYCSLLSVFSLFIFFIFIRRF